ncbi:MAG TPA: hypothetical protein VD866_14220, partial [Urbifossiella sp.]|nr:hypothetical protein [Urbifossiella sp.]
MPPLDSPAAPAAETTPDLPSLASPARSLPPARPVRKPGLLRRAARYAVVLAVVGGAAWFGVAKWKSGRHAEDVLTAAATVGDFDILVADKGELESAESVQVSCEIEGGGKLSTILAEGTQVKKGDVVARFDTDALQKA